MDSPALDALRDTLPWWFGLGPYAYVPFAALLSGLAAHLATSAGLLTLRRLPEGAHWTERARAIWPIRIAAAGAPLLSAIVLGALATLRSGPLTVPGAGAVGVAAGLAAYAAAYAQTPRVERRTGRPVTSLRDRLAGLAFVALALYPHVVIVLVAAALIPAEPLPAALTILLVLAALGGVATGGGLRVAVALGLARPADPRLAAIVDGCAAKVGFRPKGTWIVRWPMVNALAFARTGELAFTERAVRELSDEELAGVTAHELGHLGEPRGVLLARSVGLFVVAPIVLIRPVAALLTSGEPLQALAVALALVAPVLIGGLFVQRVARRMEERADAVAHEHEEDHGAYARALERIYELNLLPAVTRAKRPVHPHLYDRLVSAGVTPPYPRPAPPSALAQRGPMLLLVAILSTGALAWELAPIIAAPRDRPPPIALVALHGGDPDDLAALGAWRWGDGDLAGALPYYRALTEIEPEDPYWPAETARLEGWLGQCAASARSLEEARRRAGEDPALTELLLGAQSAVESCLSLE